MSPLLLSRLPMLCHKKPESIRSSLSNGFSSSSSLQIPPSSVNRVHASLQTPPCSLFDIVIHPREKGMGELKYFYGSATWEPNLKKKMPLDLMKEMTRIGAYHGWVATSIGASHGWVATLKNDGRVCLLDDLNPVASDTNPKRISLPPFVTLPHCQTQIVTNMAMSSSSPEDEDCIVAFKFLGPQLSFCRPAQPNCEWINIMIPDPCFFSSPLMFSKKHGMFRIPGSGGHLIGSWDLHEHMLIPKIQRLRFKNFPKLTETDQTLLDSCYKIEHLVESITTGETFLVRLYKKAKTISTALIEIMTRAAMVFKLDDEGNAFYTEDIGDLKIYLSKAESFAVSFPAINGNCIGLMDGDEWNLIFLHANLPIDAGQTWFPPEPWPYFIPPQNIVK